VGTRKMILLLTKWKGNQTDVKFFDKKFARLKFSKEKG
jgi:hypothetical protein